MQRHAHENSLLSFEKTLFDLSHDMPNFLWENMHYLIHCCCITTIPWLQDLFLVLLTGFYQLRDMLYYSVWRRYDMSPCIGSRANANYERIASCDVPMYIYINIYTHVYHFFLNFTSTFRRAHPNLPDGGRIGIPLSTLYSKLCICTRDHIWNVRMCNAS